MPWWRDALYDTCSLITLDKLFQIDGKLVRRFGPIAALEVSFSADQMRAAVRSRMRRRVGMLDLPSPENLAAVLRKATLSKALAEVDRLVYATAVSANCTVVTGDRHLGKALKQVGATVGDVAMILRAMVRAQTLRRVRCVELLKALADRNDYLLGKADPSWSDLERHRFP